MDPAQPYVKPHGSAMWSLYQESYVHVGGMCSQSPEELQRHLREDHLVDAADGSGSHPLNCERHARQHRVALGPLPTMLL